MPLSLADIKAATDILFTSSEEMERVFARPPLHDEVERALAHVNKGERVQADLFNRVLTAALLGPVDAETFLRFFPQGINSKEKLAEGIDAFVKDALLHFGSLHQAFLRIKANPRILQQTEMSFGGEKRTPFALSRSIPVERLAYLGYVSGQLPARMSDAHRAILALVDVRGGGELTAGSVREVARAKGVDLEEHLSQLNKGLTSRGAKQVTLQDFLDNQEEIRHQIDEFVAEVKGARLDGHKNLEQYINVADDMDVYVATSMRDDRDYREMKVFTDAVFGRADVARLNLRYFDPTQAYCPNKYDKGLVECLMIRCAKVTIYCAQRQDTMGKDSELAITLGQGKPVIVYVPEGPEYDQRARVFQSVHPLSLQVDQRTGNTNGIIVARNADQCANVLYALAKGELRTEARREEEVDPLSGQRSVYWVLREAVTGNRSVIRVISGWHHLRTAFWTAYRPDLHIP